ncbi:MAG: putative motility protein [Anaerolineae bacterium]|nr:putative motility protein [Anaerolineae bacterium]
MSISAISPSTALASLATGMKAQDVQMQIALAVLKQIQEQQKQQAEAFVEMIQQATPPVGSGQSLDLFA